MSGKLSAAAALKFCELS